MRSIDDSKRSRSKDTDKPLSIVADSTARPGDLTQGEPVHIEQAPIDSTPDETAKSAQSHAKGKSSRSRGNDSTKDRAGEGDTTEHQSDLQEIEVIHRLPGRLRLKISALRFQPSLANLLIQKLSVFDDTTFIRANCWCANLVIEYKPEIDEAVLLSRLANQLAQARHDEEKRRYDEEYEHSKSNGKFNRLDESDKKQLPSLTFKKSNLLRPIGLVSRVMATGLKWFNRALALLNRAMPPLIQLIVAGSALAASSLQIPAAITRGLVALSIAPIACRAFDTLLEEKKASADALDGTAAVLMLTYGRYIETSFMTTLIALGEFIRAQTARKCERMVSDLLGLVGQTAWLVRGKKRICIPAENVSVGDTVVVYPGEVVPIDGIVTGGNAAIDQSKLTGEFAPVEVTVGHEVLASTVSVEGKIYVRCTASGTATKAGQVIEAIDMAPIAETRAQNYASRVADKAIVPIFLSAAACLALTRDLVRTMSMLIFDFTTGIRISAPTSVLASMQRAGRHGILIKSGAAIEKLASMDAVLFDKTGTLTSGEPKITRVVVFNGYKERRVLELAAAVEQRLHHPASRAIVKYAQAQGITIPERVSSDFVRGMGIKAKVDELNVVVGSHQLLSSEGISTERAMEVEKVARESGESLAFIAIDGQLEALIGYSDQLRPEAVETIAALKKLGVKKLIMATGDHESAAGRVARSVGIDEVHSRMFPDHKADLVKKLKDEGYTVGVIGDGINDSPALAHADVAISLHGGTEAARHSADVILTDDDLRRLPEAIRIARGALHLIGQNITLTIVPNAVGLGLASVGMIGPAGATLLNNGSAICSAFNALRPLYSSAWSRADSDEAAQTALIEAKKAERPQ